MPSLATRYPPILGRPREKQDRAVANSLNFGVYSSISGAQVAYARVITDYATFAWLCDVYVDHAARGNGLGTALSAAILDFGFEPLAKPEKWMALGNQQPASLPDRLGADGNPGQRLPVPVPLGAVLGDEVDRVDRDRAFR
jgi:GNAT superfamily N-acetyltransferase